MGDVLAKLAKTSSALRGHRLMEIAGRGRNRIADEIEIIGALLSFRDAMVLELGCGRAWMTRKISERFKPARIVATEVDRTQHAKNLLIENLPNVEFRYGGAERIDLADSSVDVVLMLKSLHHVPIKKMDQALREIARVLKPGGLAYLSEPVYSGDFNDIMKIFHDEKAVREAAFNAIRRAVETGLLKLERQLFFDTPGHFDEFADFEARMLHVTHTQHNIDPDLHSKIYQAFMAHMTDKGADFLKPHRVDLLRR